MTLIFLQSIDFNVMFSLLSHRPCTKIYFCLYTAKGWKIEREKHMKTKKQLMIHIAKKGYVQLTHYVAILWVFSHESTCILQIDARASHFCDAWYLLTVCLLGENPWITRNVMLWIDETVTSDIHDNVYSAVVCVQIDRFSPSFANNINPDRRVRRELCDRAVLYLFMSEHNFAQ